MPHATLFLVSSYGRVYPVNRRQGRKLSSEKTSRFFISSSRRWPRPNVLRRSEVALDLSGASEAGIWNTRHPSVRIVVVSARSSSARISNQSCLLTQQPRLSRLVSRSLLMGGIAGRV